MVDKRIAVMLVVIVNGIVAVDFLLTHRVLLIPTQQHLYSPRLDFRFRRHVTRPPTTVLGIIAHTHVHDGASEVTLVFIDGFKHCSGEARSLAIA